MSSSCATRYGWNDVLLLMTIGVAHMHASWYLQVVCGFFHFYTISTTCKYPNTSTKSFLNIFFFTLRCQKSANVTNAYFDREPQVVYAEHGATYSPRYTDKSAKKT